MKTTNIILIFLGITIGLFFLLSKPINQSNQSIETSSPMPSSTSKPKQFTKAESVIDQTKT